MKRHMLAFIMTIAVAVPAIAEDSHEKYDALTRAGAQAEAAFDCAVLAMNTSKGKTSSIDAERLFQLGYASANMVALRFKELATTEGSKSGPNRFLFAVDSHFFVGLAFGKSVQRINDFLVEKVPYGGGQSFDQIMEQREFYASIEYGHRNCALIGSR